MVGPFFIFIAEGTANQEGENMEQRHNLLDSLNYSTERAAVQAIEKAWKSGDSAYFLKVLKEAAEKRGAA